ncbi:exodeoxyribonuclease III [Marchantia polymorpha subsp. ruderalis]|uniref:DNA-(apurinic or apyrimidinic site) endonuclease n=2 Tax=Marchantia polymorpha TaxID=3197 RepID=A0AAF6BWK3_MARPO|nr:hypothetical protein MARPO_0057s0088 [Marchantia polymorpha]BBN16387.1 hypothetical protein Mp_7g05830 [Marchantia polymorpha subsp. ruderalis]|eukprot:PTQ37470.1 hypothetical protein MARPO_0057s0088 [Marchantia polymorpha]
MLALPSSLVAQLRFSSLSFGGSGSCAGAFVARTRASSQCAPVLRCIPATACPDLARGCRLCLGRRSFCCSTSLSAAAGAARPHNWTGSLRRARVWELPGGVCCTSGGHAGRLLPSRKVDRSRAESWSFHHCSSGREGGVNSGNFQVKCGITFGTSGEMTSVASREGGRQLRQRKETHISLSTQAIGRKKTKGVAREATSTDDEMELRQGIEESAAATEFEARLWDLDKSNKLTTLTVLELRGYMKLMSKPTAGRKDELISTVKEWLANRESSTLMSSRQAAAIQETSSDAESLEGALLKAENKNREAEAEAMSRRIDIPAKIVNQKRKDAAYSDLKVAQQDTAVSASPKRTSVDISMSGKGRLSKTDSESNGTLDDEIVVKAVTKRKIQSSTVVKTNDAASAAAWEDQGKKRKLEQEAKDSQEEISIRIVEEKIVEINGDQKKPWLTLAHKKPQADWVPYNPETMRSASLPSSVKAMKLISWNVNGLRALIKEKDKKTEEGLLLQLAKEEDFDVLCLQETKLQTKDVEQMSSLLPGYTFGSWSCSTAKLGYSGTAIISRVEPLSVKYGMGIPDHDNEGRLITAEFESFYLVTGYIPNSGEKLVRLAYRTAEWDPALSQYLKELEKKKPVIYTGDLNCANDEIDISNPDGNRKSAGFTKEERESFKTNFLNKGLVDTFRKQHPNVLGYTYWAYRSGARVKNNGWRLDYFLVSEGLINQIHDSYIRPDVMGSDHCPIGLIVKE